MAKVGKWLSREPEAACFSTGQTSMPTFIARGERQNLKLAAYEPSCRVISAMCTPFEPAASVTATPSLTATVKSPLPDWAVYEMSARFRSQ